LAKKAHQQALKGHEAEEVETLCAQIDALKAVAAVLNIPAESLKASIGLHHTEPTHDGRPRPTTTRSRSCSSVMHEYVIST
jgi:hypothetical protein